MASKNPLQTYAQRRGFPIPAYQTFTLSVIPPLFSSTVHVAGGSFKGQPASRKKDAENSAASIALSFLNSSGDGSEKRGIKRTRSDKITGRSDVNVIKFSPLNIEMKAEELKKKNEIMIISDIGTNPEFINIVSNYSDKVLNCDFVVGYYHGRFCVDDDIKNTSSIMAPENMKDGVMIVIMSKVMASLDKYDQIVILDETGIYDDFVRVLSNRDIYLPNTVNKHVKITVSNMDSLLSAINVH